MVNKWLTLESRLAQNSFRKRPLINSPQLFGVILDSDRGLGNFIGQQVQIEHRGFHILMTKDLANRH